MVKTFLFCHRVQAIRSRFTNAENVFIMYKGTVVARCTTLGLEDCDMERLVDAKDSVRRSHLSGTPILPFLSHRQEQQQQYTH